jgi:ubiquitin carboxyl-terminal hydrolase 14
MGLVTRKRNSKKGTHTHTHTHRYVPSHTKQINPEKKMNTLRVKLKWNKATFDDVELDISKNVAAFKDTVFALTAVPPDRQKLMAKGAWVGTLKDDADLSKLKITPNLQILLMGSADVMAAPAQPVTFFEDMTSEQRAEKGVTISAGMVNLGNTCYLNSTVQCLRHMPELREALVPIRSSQTPASDISADFLYSVKQLDASGTSYTPMSFVHKFRTHFPAFAQRSNHGGYMQQDAEEFYNMLVNSLSQGVQSVRGNLDNVLNIDLEEHLVCTESEAEAPTVRRDRVYKLVCNISNAISGATQIDHMQDGIKFALEGTVEKFADTLNRNALWHKTQKLASLPKYLCVHFMRFFWKATPESRDHTGVKCKILRAVSFPEVNSSGFYGFRNFRK